MNATPKRRTTAAVTVDPTHAPTTWLYLRVSTGGQSVDAQRLGALDYCAARRLGNIRTVAETEHGDTDWRSRLLSTLAADMRAGDHLVTPEISRIARSTLDVLEVTKECAERGVTLHIVKQGMVLDASLTSRVVATVWGLAAEIEHEMIRQRTREGLALAKARGVRLGRPAHAPKYFKLDKHAEEVKRLYALGLGPASIAKIFGVKCATASAFLNERCGRRTKTKRRDHDAPTLAQ